VVNADGKFGKQVGLAPHLKQAADGTTGWRVARVPLADLGIPRAGVAITGVVFQAASDQARPEVFLDDVALLPDPSLPAAPTSTAVSITIDPMADRHAISPLIYGMAFAPPDYLTDLRLGINR